ncbi:unnamed protein product, partial [Adineta steineri]
SDEDEDTSFSSSEVSSTDDDVSISSEDEENVTNNPETTATADPILLHVRSLIKRVRSLVNLAHKSGPLSEQ